MNTLYCTIAIIALVWLLIILRKLSFINECCTYWREQYMKEYDLRAHEVEKLTHAKNIYQDAWSAACRINDILRKESKLKSNKKTTKRTKKESK